MSFLPWRRPAERRFLDLRQPLAGPNNSHTARLIDSARFTGGALHGATRRSASLIDAGSRTQIVCFLSFALPPHVNIVSRMGTRQTVLALRAASLGAGDHCGLAVRAQSASTLISSVLTIWSDCPAPRHTPAGARDSMLLTAPQTGCCANQSRNFNDCITPSPPRGLFHPLQRTQHLRHATIRVTSPLLVAVSQHPPSLSQRRCSASPVAVSIVAVPGNTITARRQTRRPTRLSGQA